MKTSAGGCHVTLKRLNHHIYVDVSASYVPKWIFVYPFFHYHFLPLSFALFHPPHASPNITPAGSSTTCSWSGSLGLRSKRMFEDVRSSPNLHGGDSSSGMEWRGPGKWPEPPPWRLFDEGSQACKLQTRISNSKPEHRFFYAGRDCANPCQ